MSSPVYPARRVVTAPYIAKLYEYNGETVTTNDPNIEGEIVRFSGVRFFVRILDNRGETWESQTIWCEHVRTIEAAVPLLRSALEERGYKWVSSV